MRTHLLSPRETSRSRKQLLAECRLPVHVLARKYLSIFGADGILARDKTPKRRLRRVDFVFDGNEIRGLEQNPETKSRWAQLARAGKKVMQFLSEGRYVANVVDRKVNLDGR